MGSNNDREISGLFEVPEWFKELGKQMEPFIAVEDVLKPWKPALESLKEVGRLMTEYFQQLPLNLVSLAHYGWFLELDEAIDLSHEMAYLLSKGDIEEVDMRLKGLYSNRIDKIIGVLSKRHPERIELLKQFKEAHLAGHYFASIPLVLSQIDGVCKDVTQQIFFMKDRNNGFKPKVVVELESKVDWLTDQLLEPLKQQTPILAHESKLSEFPRQLNRHRVMHGVSIDHGTEINSLKSLALLKYISDVLHDIIKR